MWNHLVQVYALRAQEFSDAVARLGKHTHPGPDTLGLMEEIKEPKGCGYFRTTAKAGRMRDLG